VLAIWRILFTQITGGTGRLLSTLVNFDAADSTKTYQAIAAIHSLQEVLTALPYHLSNTYEKEGLQLLPLTTWHEDFVYPNLPEASAGDCHPPTDPKRYLLGVLPVSGKSDR